MRKAAEGDGGLNHLKDLINEGLPYDSYTDLLDLVVPGSEEVTFPTDLPVIDNCEDVLGGASGGAESQGEETNDPHDKHVLNPEPNVSGSSESSKPKRRKRGRRTRRTKCSVTAAKRPCLSDDDLNRKSALVPRAPLVMYHWSKGYNSRIARAEPDAPGDVPSESVNPPSSVASETEAPLPGSGSHAVEMSLDEDTTQSESDDSETESNCLLSPSHP